VPAAAHPQLVVLVGTQAALQQSLASDSKASGRLSKLTERLQLEMRAAGLPAIPADVYTGSGGGQLRDGIEVVGA
jgi:hypothetical protein